MKMKIFKKENCYCKKSTKEIKKYENLINSITNNDSQNKIDYYIKNN